MQKARTTIRNIDRDDANSSKELEQREREQQRREAQANAVRETMKRVLEKVFWPLTAARSCARDGA